MASAGTGGEERPTAASFQVYRKHKCIGRRDTIFFRLSFHPCALRTTRVLLLTLLGFFVVEALVFNTDFYASRINPDSAAGLLELKVQNEIHRVTPDRNQVVAIGDSRMGFFPRFPNESTPGTGYTYASIATAGTTARCWYYMLRAVDPTARRYAAIVIGMNDYEDAETWDNNADYISDLHYLIARLRWSDLVEFSSSYHDPALKWQAARGILLKGLVYQTDFQDFLRDPRARLKYVNLAANESKNWTTTTSVPGTTCGTSASIGPRELSAHHRAYPAVKSPSSRSNSWRPGFAGGPQGRVHEILAEQDPRLLSGLRHAHHFRPAASRTFPSAPNSRLSTRIVRYAN